MCVGLPFADLVIHSHIKSLSQPIQVHFRWLQQVLQPIGAPQTAPHNAREENQQRHPFLNKGKKCISVRIFLLQEANASTGFQPPAFPGCRILQWMHLRVLASLSPPYLIDVCPFSLHVVLLNVFPLFFSFPSTSFSPNSFPSFQTVWLVVDYHLLCLFCVEELHIAVEMTERSFYFHTRSIGCGPAHQNNKRLNVTLVFFSPDPLPFARCLVFLYSGVIGGRRLIGLCVIFPSCALTTQHIPLDMEVAAQGRPP